MIGPLRKPILSRAELVGQAVSPAGDADRLLAPEVQKGLATYYRAATARERLREVPPGRSRNRRDIERIRPTLERISAPR
jgi:hypothetical protein